jgi:hypothetical protein
MTGRLATSVPTDSHNAFGSLKASSRRKIRPRAHKNASASAALRSAVIGKWTSIKLATLHPLVIEALGCPAERDSLASLRYDLSKLRAKGLLTRLPHSRRFQLSPQGYSISLVFLSSSSESTPP